MKTIEDIARRGDSGTSNGAAEVAEYVTKLKREYESLDDETLARWIQGHFEACRHAMEFHLEYSAAIYGWKLHKMWQVVEARREGG